LRKLAEMVSAQFGAFAAILDNLEPVRCIHFFVLRSALLGGWCIAQSDSTQVF
jgi:hypothetical protein